MTVRVPADIRQALREVALVEKRTVSWLVVEVLRQWLKWRKQGGEDVD